MSGWIRWTKDLETDSRLVRMARELKRRNAARNAVEAESVTQSVTVSVTCSVTSTTTALTIIVGALVRLWSHADSHIRSDDTLDMSLDEIDELVGVPGFAASMPEDWLIKIDDNTVELPNFQAHNGIAAKRKALNAKRQSNFRSRTSVTESVTVSVTGALRGALPRPDQTRPEEETQSRARRGELNGETRREKPPTFDPASVPGLDVAAWNTWVDYRAERTPAIKAVSMREAAEELAAFGAQQAAVVRHSKANGYQGLVAPKANGNGTHAADPRQAEREALHKLSQRRKSVEGLKDFRDPLPGESAKQYRDAQDAAFNAYQDSKHKPRAGEGTFAQIGNILGQRGDS